MNKISAGDKIFDFECENNWSFSYYGWEFDNCHAFYNYMIGYKTAADATYEAFKKAIFSRDNEVTDTICYPLIFLYRHMIELILKYSYVELRQNYTSGEIMCFLNKGHDLEMLWKEVKPDYERLSTRIGVDIDISAIEHYIVEFAKADKSSMEFRYPINKKTLNRFHDYGKYLFVPKLKERMDAFYDYMIDILNRLSFHMADDVYNIEFDKQFTEAIYKSMANIKVALERINKNIEQYKGSSSEVVGKDILSSHSLDKLNKEENAVNDWISSFSEQDKSVILLLYYTGLQIPLNGLAIDTAERRKDVMKLAYGNSRDDFQLNSPKSISKDDCFRTHIAYGNTLSKRRIESSLSELGIRL